MVNLSSKISNAQAHHERVDNRYQFLNGALSFVGMAGISIFSNVINNSNNFDSGYEETETKTVEKGIDLKDNTQVEKALEDILKDKNINVEKNTRKYNELKDSFINKKELGWSDDKVANFIADLAKVDRIKATSFGI